MPTETIFPWTITCITRGHTHKIGIAHVNPDVWKRSFLKHCVNLWNRVNCPCPEQGLNPNSQLLSAIFAPILPTEPLDHGQTIQKVPMNGSIVIMRFYG